MAVMTYDMAELERLSGVSARTVRNWMQANLLPRGQGRGRAASYDDRHVRRLRVIQHLRDKEMSIAAIRSRIRGLTEAQLDDMIMKGAVPTTPAVTPEPPALPVYPSTACEIIQLMDGLTLTVDPSKGEVVQRVAAAIYRHYSHRR